MDLKYEDQGTIHTVDSATVELRPVLTAESIAGVATMAQSIWVEHFTPIIGPLQVSYMLERFQSKPAISNQIGVEGYRYFFVTNQEKLVGYTAVVPMPEKSVLLLSKLYIDRQFRGNGFGRATVTQIARMAIEEGFASIRLTVNKNNLSSIEAYKQFGFQITAEAVQDIGGGFFMDDYVMSRELPPIVSSDSPN